MLAVYRILLDLSTLVSFCVANMPQQTEQDLRRDEIKELVKVLGYEKSANIISRKAPPSSFRSEYGLSGETLKKQLQRKTTSLARLNLYFTILKEEFKYNPPPKMAELLGVAEYRKWRKIGEISQEKDAKKKAHLVVDEFCKKLESLYMKK